MAFGAAKFTGIGVLKHPGQNDIGGALNSIFGSGDSQVMSANPATYDPYAPYRAQAATQLNQLMSNPSMAYSMPGFSSMMQQGQRSVNAGMAATGQLQSGAEQSALQQVGMNTANQYYNQMFNQLSMLSGANQSPYNGAMAAQQAGYLNQQVASQQAGFNMGSIATIGSKLFSLF
jgi:hypothetical protein